MIAADRLRSFNVDPACLSCGAPCWTVWQVGWKKKILSVCVSDFHTLWEPPPPSRPALLHIQAHVWEQHKAGLLSVPKITSRKLGVWGEGTVLIIVCLHHAHISLSSVLVLLSPLLPLLVFWGKQNAEQNWFSFLVFHIIVGTHALWFLWVLIHRRRYYALKAPTAIYARSDLARQTTNVEIIYYCYQLCACGIGRLSQFCSGQTGKSFPLCSLRCLVSGKPRCSNLHCFACWLMLCLWKRSAWCEVNSCALQYHCIPFFFLFPLFQCVILCW